MVRRALGGSLRAGDVRRFFAEVMVAAMNADGHVDQRELAVLERIMDEHELFCALPPHVTAQLRRSAVDAFEFNPDIHARVPVIARNLLSRSHRLFAMAMACEVVAADNDVAASELAYLSSLREGLMLGEREYAALVDAAGKGCTMAAAERLSRTIVRLIGPLIDVCMVRNLLARSHTDSGLVSIISNLPDMAMHRHGIAEQLARVPGDVASWSVSATLARAAGALPTPADRYWLSVFSLAVDHVRGATGQRAPHFGQTLGYALAVDRRAMTRAVDHARAIARRIVGD